MAEDKTLLTVSVAVSAFKELHPFPKVEAAGLCRAIGGTFGNDDRVGIYKTVHWTCDDIPINRAIPQYQLFEWMITVDKFFAPACDPYPGSSIAGTVDENVMHLTCGS